MKVTAKMAGAIRGDNSHLSGLTNPLGVVQISFVTLTQMTSREDLKFIRFSGELLPDWAELLDLAARLCPVSETVENWFSRLTSSSGVDDARIVTEACSSLRSSLQAHRDFIIGELRRNWDDDQPAQIFSAWMYALDTMMQSAEGGATCSWIIEGTDNVTIDGSDGDITLRRV